MEVFVSYVISRILYFALSIQFLQRSVLKSFLSVHKQFGYVFSDFDFFSMPEIIYIGIGYFVFKSVLTVCSLSGFVVIGFYIKEILFKKLIEHFGLMFEYC